MEGSDRDRARRLLIAMDQSENARRAVSYTADLLGDAAGSHVTLASIIPVVPEDFFPSALERQQRTEDQRQEAVVMLEGYRQQLLRSGFDEGRVAVRVDLMTCPSIGGCILSVQRQLGCGTVVIGRRGISKKEEFIYGSTSNKILHAAKDCTVWVIE